MSTRTLPRTLGALSLGLTLALGATACGDDTEAARTVETSPTEHNDADVAFATDMIQHHAQALSMVDLTLERPLDPEVQALAEEIRAAQAPEIETMADWLTDWDEPVPETMRDHTNAGHDMGDMSDTMDDMEDHGSDMPGMMSADDMDALEGSADADFQQMWLEMMIEHHEGAIEMARSQQAGGRFEPAVDLAGQVIDSQTEEIATMRELLEG
ncbi:DUF305 domain-containing protein [Nocardioides sp. S5]|uniref:DUF305 domain-containing protein n=1 Tax=Nocardioides sp. S5 TaxID=2017486 RepID=UPI001A8FCF5B|nr:DUF305 domain-containing protein [Nocardioides sp. S5]QSR29036.1 DUF305 domain-containing protein [Nocardioides sp. S5]